MTKSIYTLKNFTPPRFFKYFSHLRADLTRFLSEQVENIIKLFSPKLLTFQTLDDIIVRLVGKQRSKLCRNGGIGRRPGLKIPWDFFSYRFDPGFRHHYIAEWSSLVARRAHNPEVMRFKSHLRNQKNSGYPFGCPEFFLFGCREEMGFEPHELRSLTRFCGVPLALT